MDNQSFNINIGYIDDFEDFDSIEDEASKEIISQDDRKVIVVDFKYCQFSVLLDNLRVFLQSLNEREIVTWDKWKSIVINPKPECPVCNQNLTDEGILFKTQVSGDDGMSGLLMLHNTCVSNIQSKIEEKLEQLGNQHFTEEL